MKIFAILVLCEKTKYLECFINAGLCDNKLPLEFNAITGKPFGCTSAEAQCFDKWKPAAADAFAKAQYELLVPYFGLPYSRNGVKPIIRHAKYRTEAIFPWIDLEKRCEGGFGEITCIRIHSASHGFHNVEQVQAANFELALKHMKSDDITNFENESKMLKLFSNHHEHIVKLLMSFSVADQNYLLFPWAGYDLGNYWENNNAPFDLTTNTMDRPKMQWLSAQILGLVSAVHTLHNPPHLDSLSPEAKKYARHGDIKPQNVLWFKTSSRPEGIFVIGDLGIASVHRLISRSNIPNHALPCSPDYRPPECDQEGGIISRAYDIWTLGCLLLEMICWALGGEKLRKEFEDSRMLVTYIGVMSNIFFDVKRALDGSAAILVKEVVIEQMEKLHEHEGCTEYFHDLLDIIHDSMIVVLSKTTERIRSKELHANIQILNGRMTNPAYGVVPKPRKRKYSAPIAVKTELNDFGKSRFEKFHAKLEPYDARAEEAKTAYEMRRMD
ncbi:kinase-like protein [Byssothecium circinans]|uniref:Kinase-like protein n=1 Tax=Byssothecium circinans TaxID=147558 RepID=A0A6A5T884_9PLEO|nr:kinase-like protein [Byssothecium circinans]